MSFNILSSEITNDNHDEDVMKFCMQLVNQSQWKTKRMFLSGSIVDIPNFRIIGQKFGVDICKLDIDHMAYKTAYYAANSSVPFAETFNGAILRVYTDNVHAGFTNLIVEKTGKALFMSDDYSMMDAKKKHGPALLIESQANALLKTYSLSNTASHSANDKYFKIPFMDMVHAVHSPYWPVDANEWILRKRMNGLPTNSVIKKIVRYGCDFVKVSHKTFNYDNEWRFSFSRAEQFLTKSWTMSQRIVYSTLWVLNKKIDSSNLCSYYFKTLMFWACEEKFPQFWEADTLSDSVIELLIEMMSCVQRKFCPNYFISENNMMDHWMETDVLYEIRALWEYVQSKELISEIVNATFHLELITPDKTPKIEAPDWILRAYVIIHRIHRQNDNYTDVFCTFLQPELHDALYTELSDIYRGLRFQQMALNCVRESERQNFFEESKCYLISAINLCHSQKQKALYNCSPDIVKMIAAHCIVRDIYNADLDESKTASNAKMKLEPNVSCDVGKAEAELNTEVQVSSCINNEGAGSNTGVYCGTIQAKDEVITGISKNTSVQTYTDNIPNEEIKCSYDEIKCGAGTNHYLCSDTNFNTGLSNANVELNKGEFSGFSRTSVKGATCECSSNNDNKDTVANFRVMTADTNLGVESIESVELNTDGSSSGCNLPGELNNENSDASNGSIKPLSNGAVRVSSNDNCELTTYVSRSVFAESSNGNFELHIHACSRSSNANKEFSNDAGLMIGSSEKNVEQQSVLTSEESKTTDDSVESLPCDTNDTSIDLNTSKSNDAMKTQVEPNTSIASDKSHIICEESTDVFGNAVDSKISDKSARCESIDKSVEGRTFNIGIYDRDCSEETINQCRSYILLKEWPGQSLTVNISWFIAKAYLANLYYTTERDFSLTISTCDDIINAYSMSSCNVECAEGYFPVVLSTQWTNIYDKEIQELLGFYSLCSFVLDPSRCSVYLGVCPVWFAHYLKLRLFGLKRYSENYNEHVRECVHKCDKRLHNGYVILTTAVRNYFTRRGSSVYFDQK